jgi:predicted DNA-binding mobile mystery protein A
MKPEFRGLRLRQLDRALKPFYETKLVTRPRKGWVRAIREATGITLQSIAQKLSVRIPAVSAFERNEAEYRITLGSLRDLADALGCQLVYAIVPKQGTIKDLAEDHVKSRVSENVRAVEHSMALEDQAVGNVEEKIREEAERRLKQR